MQTKTGCRPSNTIDFDLIRDTVSLESVIVDRLGPPVKGSWLCPFHSDHRPSLRIKPSRKGWKCWAACGANGDVVDFVSMYDRITKGEAAKVLTGETSTTRPRKPPPKPAPKVEPPPVWQDEEWQTVVAEVIEKAEACLWSRSSDGRNARDWLRSRCFRDETIRRFHLGFVPAEDWTRRVAATGYGIAVNRGITIPWLAPGADHKTPNVGRVATSANFIGTSSNLGRRAISTSAYPARMADMLIPSRTSCRAKAIGPP